MRYSILIVAFLMFNLTGYSQTTSGQEDRTYWVNILSQIADPLLNSMSKGELKKNMPVETISGVPNPSNARTTHLEALGRLFVGMAPWLELGPDNTQEGQIREKYIRLMTESINHGFNPQSPDYLNFTVTRQPLVDTAFFCQGLLRSPKQIWSKLSAETQKNILNALQQVSKIKPVESNWLLFSAMVEATLLELTGKCNMHPIEYAIMRFKEWYKGDSWYGDGINLHMDYYNSFVIHPMLLDILEIMQKHNKGETDFYKKRTATFLQICRTTRKNDFSGWSIPCNRPFYSIPFWNVPCTFNSSSKRFATNYHYQVTSPMRPNCCYKKAHGYKREFRRTWMADFRVCRTSTTNS